jgi:hypothetical protein
MSAVKSPTIRNAQYNGDNLADAPLTAWHLVKRTATGVDLAGAGVNVYGVVTADCSSGSLAVVAISADLVTCECSGTVTIGEAVKSATGGKIATASSGDTACGIAEATGTDTYITFRPLTFKAA